MTLDINKVTIGVVLEHPDAKLPVKVQGNLGIDLHCIADENFFTLIHADGTSDMAYDLKPFSRYIFQTGIRLEIPSGWAIEFGDRSGLAAKNGLTVLAGKIDSSFTGLIQVVLYNSSNQTVRIMSGDRICQMVVTKDWDSQFVEITKDQLKQTERGDKGFGSSGR